MFARSGVLWCTCLFTGSSFFCSDSSLTMRQSAKIPNLFFVGTLGIVGFFVVVDIP